MFGSRKLSAGIRVRALLIAASIVATIGIATTGSAVVDCQYHQTTPPVGEDGTYVDNSGCVPNGDTGEEGSVFLFRDIEGHPAPCWAVRTHGGYNWVCIINPPTDVVPGDGGPGSIPLDPRGWCADHHMFTDPDAPWLYTSWCIPTGDIGFGEPPYVYILENKELQPQACVGVRLLDGYYFLCSLRQPL